MVGIVGVIVEGGCSDVPGGTMDTAGSGGIAGEPSDVASAVRDLHNV